MSQQWSRRMFMKGVASAAAAGPYVVSASALGLGGVLAPSNRINVGIIGCGLIAESHRGALLQRADRVRIRAVCDVKRAQRQAYKRAVEAHYGGQYQCDAYKDYEQLLARDDIDAVFVTTPDHWHAILATRAMQAGKDVYCEKPLTLTVGEARSVADTAARHGTIFQTGSQQRSDHAFRQAATIVRNGWIGEIETVDADLGRFPPRRELPARPIPEGIDYDRWLGPAPWEPYHPDRVKGDYGGGWRIYRDYSGRKNTDWGAHHFDIIQWALGMDESGPVEFIPAGQQGLEFQTHRYEGGPIVRRRGPEAGMIKFMGTEGTVWVARDGFLKTDPPSLARKKLSPNDQQLYVSDDHHDNFFQCIRTRRQTICPATVGAHSAMVCHLNNIARWVGRPVQWDPINERVVGDEVAARWLDRPDRAPWRL